MRTSHRRSSMARGSARRKLVWATAESGFTLTAGTVATNDLLNALEVGGASKLGATVMRTHLEVVVGYTTPGVQPFLWCGLKASDQNELTALVSPAS